MEQAFHDIYTCSILISSQQIRMSKSCSWRAFILRYPQRNRQGGWPYGASSMCLCGTPHGAPSQRHHGEAGALCGQRPRILQGVANAPDIMLHYITLVHFHNILVLVPPVFLPSEWSKQLSHAPLPQRSTSYSAQCLAHRALGNGPGTAVSRRFWRSKATGASFVKRCWEQRDRRWTVEDGRITKGW